MALGVPRCYHNGLIVNHFKLNSNFKGYITFKMTQKEQEVLFLVTLDAARCCPQTGCCPLQKWPIEVEIAVRNYIKWLMHGCWCSL